MAADLDIDTDAVRGAAATARSAPAAAPAAAITLIACAPDSVSVYVAARLRGAVGEWEAATTAVHGRAAAAADQLAATAQSYDAQESAAANALTPGGRATGAVVGPGALLIPPTAPPIPAPGFPAGTEPLTGRQASALIHAGPGSHGFDSAATRLDTQANGLERSAAWIRSARSASDSAWSSSAADTAAARLRRLEVDYAEQADAARRLSRQFRGHAEDYRRVRASIPAPQVFDAITARLRQAVTANAMAPAVGRYGPAISALQGELAQANHSALSAYRQYRAASADPGTGPAPQRPEDARNRTGGEAGTGSTGDRLGQAPTGADLSGGDADGGSAGGGGADLPAGHGDPGAGEADPGGDSGTELFATVLPAVLSGATGLIGGLAGGLTAAGQGVAQAGAQLVGGLTQAAGAGAAKAALPDPGGEFAPGDTAAAGPGGGADAPGGGDLGGFGAGGGAGDPGGGAYGDTSPASVPGGPPGTFPTAAPATAAPATFSPAGTPQSTAGPAAGGPAMMPPMTAAGVSGGASAGDADRRLYPARRLRVEAPPNAEPVKGRREVRKSLAGSSPTEEESR